MQPGASWRHWSGAAVDPDTGMLYVPSKQGMGVIRLNSAAGRAANLNFLQATPRSPNMPGGVPCWPPHSRMTAIDMNTGEHA
jgi:quinoprotein glucose dehydrogenase